MYAILVIDYTFYECLLLALRTIMQKLSTLVVMLDLGWLIETLYPLTTYNAQMRQMQ